MNKYLKLSISMDIIDKNVNIKFTLSKIKFCTENDILLFI